MMLDTIRYLVAAVAVALCLAGATVEGGDKEQKNDGQKNQKDDGHGNKKDAVLKAQKGQGRKIVEMRAQLANGRNVNGVLKPERVEGDRTGNGDDGQQNQKDDGQQNQKDDSQQNQKDDGQQNQNGGAGKQG